MGGSGPPRLYHVGWPLVLGDFKSWTMTGFSSYNVSALSPCIAQFPGGIPVLSRCTGTAWRSPQGRWLSPSLSCTTGRSLSQDFDKTNRHILQRICLNILVVSQFVDIFSTWGTVAHFKTRCSHHSWRVIFATRRRNLC